MAITRQRLTVEEFLARPDIDEKPYLEYEDGEVTQKEPSGGPHSVLQVVAAELFTRTTRPRKLALALTELRTTFAGASRLPDVAVYRWERIPRTADGEIDYDFLTPPDIAIEIASPSQSTNRLIRRCQRFLAGGVHVVLLVDPEDKSIAVFRSEGTITVRAGDQIDLGDVIPAFPLDVRELFDALKLD
jgi:Uma2 family endonuclease